MTSSNQIVISSNSKTMSSSHFDGVATSLGYGGTRSSSWCTASGPTRWGTKVEKIIQKGPEQSSQSVQDSRAQSPFN